MNVIKGNLEKKYHLDFSLIYFGLFLLESGILFGNSSRHREVPFHVWVPMVGIHTSLIVIAIELLKRANSFKSRLFSIIGLSSLGTLMTALAEIAFVLTGKSLGAPHFRLIGVAASTLIFGAFWFPIVVILGGYRGLILSSLNNYEYRLITESRKLARTTPSFLGIEQNLEQKISSELDLLCNRYIENIQIARTRSGDLSTRASEIQKVLSNTAIRDYTMFLEQRGSRVDSRNYISRGVRSVSIISRQYRLLYWQTLKAAPLKSFAYPVLIYMISLPSMLQTFSFEKFLSFSVVLFVLCWAIARLIPAVAFSSRQRAPLYYSALILLIGYIPYILQIIGDVASKKHGSDYPVAIIGGSLPISFYVLVRIRQIIQRQTFELIESGNLSVSRGVRKSIESVIAYEFEQVISHSWAVFIHGKILTRLAATSIQVENAASLNDQFAFDKAIDSLEDILKNYRPSSDQEARPLDVELQSRIMPWDGIVDIALEISETLSKATNKRCVDVGEVVEEALSNSVRHGKARKIVIKVEPMGENDIHISIQDNSAVELPTGQARYGLGTKLFNLNCDGNWRLTHDHTGTLFHAVMNFNRPTDE